MQTRPAPPIEAVSTPLGPHRTPPGVSALPPARAAVSGDYEVVWKDGERLSLHARIEDAESAADDLWGPCEQSEERDGSISFHGSEYDGEGYVGITHGFVREVVGGAS